jgi:DNA-binding transcriptional LysR family regulator
MELRHLKTFVTVARLLSFNRAADVLNYAQSSVSVHVQTLEKELGVPLFDRLGRQIMLTEAGEHLLGYAGKMLDLEQEALAEMREGQEARGSLTIRVPETLCVYRFPELLRRFHSRAPGVALQLITCAHESLARDLRKGVTDLAFLLTESITAGDLEVEALGTEPLLLVSAPDHPLAGRDVVRTADLHGETLLLSGADCSYRRLLEQIMAEDKVLPGSTLELSSVAAIKQCVAQGLGITLIPEIAVRHEMAQGRLVALPWSEGTAEVACLMIWLRERWLSPRLQQLMQLAREIVYQSP